jgi:hypothetical protein
MGGLSISGAASTACGKCDGGGMAIAVPGGIGMFRPTPYSRSSDPPAARLPCVRRQCLALRRRAALRIRLLTRAHRLRCLLAPYLRSQRRHHRRRRCRDRLCPCPPACSPRPRVSSGLNLPRFPIATRVCPDFMCYKVGTAFSIPTL